MSIVDKERPGLPSIVLESQVPVCSLSPNLDFNPFLLPNIIVVLAIGIHNHGNSVDMVTASYLSILGGTF